MQRLARPVNCNCNRYFYLGTNVRNFSGIQNIDQIADATAYNIALGKFPFERTTEWFCYAF